MALPLYKLTTSTFVDMLATPFGRFTLYLFEFVLHYILGKGPVGWNPRGVVAPGDGVTSRCLEQSHNTFVHTE